MMQSHTSTIAPTLLRLPAVLARVGVSKATLYRWSRIGQFPRPHSLTANGSTVAWSSSEVDAWIKSKVATNDGTFDGILKSDATQTA